jgi:outer membrane lipoprotein-sorting protein
MHGGFSGRFIRKIEINIYGIIQPFRLKYHAKGVEMIRRIFSFMIYGSVVLAMLVIFSEMDVSAQDANSLVKAGFDYWRGESSEFLVDMKIHRPDWERTVTLKGWTRGEKDSLISIVAPAKDKGNGTLKKGREMWMFNPKVNRVMKLPPSMMAQSWMGSDFSNNDLAKSDSILTDYDHSITGTENHKGKKVYTITSIPKPSAPVVWGMQKLKIREDHILLGQEFYDEDLNTVKVMTGYNIQMLGGKLFPKTWKMKESDETDKYTELTYRELSFKKSLPGHIFTLSNLKKPRR